MLTLPFTITPPAKETDQLTRQLSIDLDALLTVENVGLYAQHTLFNQICPEQCSPMTAMALEHLQNAMALAHSMIESDVRQSESRIKQTQNQERKAS